MILRWHREALLLSPLGTVLWVKEIGRLFAGKRRIMTRNGTDDENGIDDKNWDDDEKASWRTVMEKPAVHPNKINPGPRARGLGGWFPERRKAGQGSAGKVVYLFSKGSWQEDATLQEQNE